MPARTYIYKRRIITCLPGTIVTGFICPFVITETSAEWSGKPPLRFPSLQVCQTSEEAVKHAHEYAKAWIDANSL
ncbi:hypothetical protein HNQ50_000026 [Silvimonas terrae]|uniref:Uncharacterized protein n=1 Tax=Silvimonas terrae TaxID=300266 RepID=A0A840RA34_9NEIS|nr:hypothetical protein [Silvimonas terrae]